MKHTKFSKRSAHGSAKRYFHFLCILANSKQECFKILLVLSSNLNYFCLKQINCFEAILYFICFKKCIPFKQEQRKFQLKIVFLDLLYSICLSHITQIVSLHDKSVRYFANFGSLQALTTKVCDRHGKNLRTPGRQPEFVNAAEKV